MVSESIHRGYQSDIHSEERGLGVDRPTGVLDPLQQELTDRVLPGWTSEGVDEMEFVLGVEHQIVLPAHGEEFTGCEGAFARRAEKPSRGVGEFRSSLRRSNELGHCVAWAQSTEQLRIEPFW
ncbi:hypothetical protein ABZX12_26380 [Kribbella sp. NPDC003505]|uniref:hypothetical protein n=1 Tax=Kribbella sp. NPDC003505 TaxID=3154448 RepID=UPI0033B0C11A